MQILAYYFHLKMLLENDIIYLVLFDVNFSYEIGTKIHENI